MNTKNIMNAIGGISDEFIEKYAEVKPVVIKGEKAKKRNRFLIFAASAAAVLVAALLLIPILKKGREPGNQHGYVINNTPSPSTAPETVVPITPTVDPVTPTPEIVTPTPTPEVTVTSYNGGRSAYMALTHTVLSGGDFEDQLHEWYCGGVFFTMEDEGFVAYERAILRSTGTPGVDYDERYEFYDPIETYPAELGHWAYRAVGDYLRANGFADFTGDEGLQLFGYIGEDYIIVTDAPQMGSQSVAIFRRDSSGNWVEFPVPDKQPTQITGGCVLSDKVAYICYQDRGIMHSGDYTPRQLVIWRTTDGGQTWEDINLWIPEEYEGYICPPAYVFSPVFEGDHGMIVVAYCVYNPEVEYGFEQHSSWFETNDGGNTWVFHLD